MTSAELVKPGWRAPAPTVADLANWSDDFGTRFAIFVDTEEAFDWSAPFSRDARDVSAIAALPEAHHRFASRGIGITYLADHPVATDERSIDTLRTIVADGRSAIGAQLHAWVTPPFDEPLSPAASFAGNLPRSLEAAKIDAITNAVTAAFGRPRVFRAGRYGLGANSFALLAERGYALDTSVRPGFSYLDEGGPDFTAAGRDAYWPEPTRRLLELPATTSFTGFARRGGAALHRTLGRFPRGRGVFARAGLLSRVPLTPEGVPVREALEAIRVTSGEGARVLTFAFHSPSLVPGNTPYVRDAADLLRFWTWWDAVLDLLDRRGIRPATSAELMAAAR